MHIIALKTKCKLKKNLTLLMSAHAQHELCVKIRKFKLQKNALFKSKKYFCCNHLDIVTQTGLLASCTRQDGDILKISSVMCHNIIKNVIVIAHTENDFKKWKGVGVWEAYNVKD